MDKDSIDFGIEASTEGSRRTTTFRYLLRYLGLPAGATAVDLGAGPCIFARIASTCGLLVTAVDGRIDRVPTREELEPVKFVQSDVRNFNIEGFDLVMILGLLYHLELNDQIALLQRASGAQAVVVDTQVHIPELHCSPQPERFSDLYRTEEGYEGIDFTELDNPMAAVGNPRSFWHTEKSLLKLFERVGYSSVVVVEPPYQSKHGARKFFLLKSI